MATGETLDVDVGGDLTVASVQDTASSSGSGSNFSFNTGGSASIGGSDSGSDYAWVTEQSGLTATGEADIKVEGHTQLDGGVIGSETEDALTFETGTFGFTDIFDNDEAHDNSLNVSAGFGGGAIQNGTLSGDLYNHDREQINRATVAGGDVTITDEEAQAELAANAEDGVNYDPDAVNTDLDKAQEITKDETNSATVYVDGAAIEEIAKGFPTVQEAIDNMVDLMTPVSPELAAAIKGGNIDYADALSALAQCGQGGSQQVSIWNFNWLIASPAYADDGCILYDLDGNPIVIDDYKSCLRILAEGAAKLLLSGSNRQEVLDGLMAGLAAEGQEFVDLVSDPAKAVGELGKAIEMLVNDPMGVGADIINGYIQQFGNILNGVNSGDFTIVGEEMASLMIDVAMTLVSAGAVGAGFKILDKVMDRARRDRDADGDGIDDRTGCSYVSLDNFWNFNWLLGSAAYAGDCFKGAGGTLDNPPDHLRPNEIESGKRLEDELGQEVRPLENQADGDFVDGNGVTYDTMGMPNAYSNWGDGTGFINSINSHLNKSVDHVVIDLTGSSPAQQQQILDHLTNSNHPNVDKIIFVGG